jgi:hypothetical protein
MSLTRRQIFKTGASLLAGGLAVAESRGSAAAEPPISDPKSSMIGVGFERKDEVRFGIVGVGGRGTSSLRNLLAIPHARVNAVCDPIEEKVLRARDLVTKAGQPAPAMFPNGDHDFENLVKRDDVDFVYIATPWDWHVPVALAAMEAGKHTGMEVPGATTIEDCWKIVDTSENTRRHCMIMENCCYGANELLVLTMIRAGVFGDLIHGQAAYLHDLRSLLFSNAGEGLWRRLPHAYSNGNLYPTHGLGPVANYMGINRGDRLDYMVSMSSPQKGLDAYRSAHVPPGDPKWRERYVCGDLNTSILKTVNGLTILLQHDVSNARPYSRLNMIQGINGLFEDYPPRIYIEGDQKNEEFGSLAPYQEKYTHPLWKSEGEAARASGGHGGMDYLMLWRLVQCFREGLPPDMDVYDAASWGAPGPLSEVSVAEGSQPVTIPDFTRNRWKERTGPSV